MFAVRIFVCASILLLATGCGRSGRPALVPFGGRLTLDGKPLGGKAVKLIPENGAADVEVTTSFHTATSAEDGSYAVRTFWPGALNAKPGVMPGRYVVIVTEPEAAGGPPPGSQPPQKSTIPAPYKQSRTTKLRVEVPPKGGTVDLELVSRP